MPKNEEIKKRIAEYGKGKSKCVCGHLGDGLPSSHGGLMGHGACTVDGCGCQKFTWAGWSEEFEQYLKLVMKGGQGILFKDEGVLT